jgi:hypothetical protein
MPDDLHAMCERGQLLLERMEYLQAEQALVQAEGIALARRDFETLGRLYMPLQEARRQRRQRCGEGLVCLDFIARGPDDTAITASEIVARVPHGQLLIAGWGSIQPAIEMRRLQQERNLFVETFLAAAYPIGDARAVVIVPNDDASLPAAGNATRSIDDLIRHLPPHCIVLNETELPRGMRRGDWQTYAEVMGIWERLHASFLALADSTVELLARIEAYRRTIRVDYACEFAHQRLADAARSYARRAGSHAGPR